jgi:hypothetical protein
MRMVRRRHGDEALLMPAAHVVATRRTDLRTFWRRIGSPVPSEVLS